MGRMTNDNILVDLMVAEVITRQNKSVREHSDVPDYANPIEVMQYHARKLLEKSGIDNPPFLPERYAHLQGIKKIIKTDLGRIDALLLRLDDGYAVKLNALHHPVRQNFSLAHEIAHTFLMDMDMRLGNSTTKLHSCSGGSTSAEEALCHIGAAELLMPAAKFKRYTEKYGFSIRSIWPIARAFQTSIGATTRRFTEIAPEPCLVIAWTFREGPNSNKRKLRILWSHQPSKKTDRDALFIPHNKSIKENSIIYEAYSSDKATTAFELLSLGNLKGSYYIESKGFSYGARRYVLSLVFLER